MFTGLIEVVGKLEARQQGTEGGSLKVACSGLQGDLKQGDSVAVNGVCLTVTAFDAWSFTADVMKATLDSTTLGKLPLGTSVNLERALRMQDRLGGHMVSGHVDGIARVGAVKPVGGALAVEVEAPEVLKRYLPLKGSVALDGVSLTIQRLTESGFEIGLVPHTQGVTSFQELRRGQEVNLECDLLARYMERLLMRQEDTGSLTLERLVSLGY